MDMLVKLYEVQSDDELDRHLAERNFHIRPALAPELQVISEWIRPRFGSGWVGEATVAICRQPVACLIATRARELVGFACYDATARGFFGPTGVDASVRGNGIGKALLIRTLLAMRDQGYGYAVIGGAGPMDFYRTTVGAIPIEGSAPGIYRGMLNIRDDGPQSER